MSLGTTLLVILGGATGTFARYAVSLLTLPISRGVPWGTIGINLSGSFLIGFFGTLTLAHGRFAVPENVRLLVMVGFCGGYTTFSSFSLQTYDLLRADAPGRAVANIVLSLGLCLSAVAAGHALGAALNGGAVQVAQAAIEEDA